MAADDNFRFTIAKIESTRFQGDPKVFAYDSREFLVFSDVFSPVDFPSTAIFTRMLTFPRGSFLEIGCGAGVTAVMAALSGCPRVVATDINPAAVANAEANAKRHRVESVMDVRQGDVFTPLAAGETFDAVFWNSSFVYTEPDQPFADLFQRSCFDPGYAGHARYLGEAARYLAPGGTLLLGFSDRGDQARLDALCAENGFRPHLIDSETVAATQTTYKLLRLEPTR